MVYQGTNRVSGFWPSSRDLGREASLLTRLRSPVGSVLPLASWLHRARWVAEGAGNRRLTGLDGYFASAFADRPVGEEFTADEMEQRPSRSTSSPGPVPTSDLFLQASGCGL